MSNLKKFETLEEVWAAIDSGLIVNWVNDAYKLTVEDSQIDWRREHGYALPYSNRGDKCLRVTCIGNYFGSLLDPNELTQLFVKE